MQNARGADLNNHAERLAMGLARGGDTILLVQNAFPCQDRSPQGAPGCHDYLIRQSTAQGRRAGINTVVRVDHDHGLYSTAHPVVVARQRLGLSILPCAIYYEDGNVSYTFIRNAPIGQLPNIWDKPEANPE
ncbi:hypothetical protein [Vineibacter terrae]|uniref:hypothetical protein n=1 Tax=Vineibacter terrae TaxID=2586908 RepID=UPI002E33090B|nr:hypothetical protein [Vineibacter terrae]HEX2884836.1 hypothetical protein [Vineibacter terrae]